MMRSAILTLRYPGKPEVAERVKGGICRVYEEARWLRPDAGGKASTEESTTAATDAMEAR